MIPTHVVKQRRDCQQYVQRWFVDNATVTSILYQQNGWLLQSKAPLY